MPRYYSWTVGCQMNKAVSERLDSHLEQLGYQSTITAEVQGTADSLATSQMEYVLSQDYDDTSNPPQYALISDVPDNWLVDVKAEWLDPENDGTDDDDGIQEIYVAVNYAGERVVTLVSRKVNLNYVP